MGINPSGWVRPPRPWTQWSIPWYRALHTAFLVGDLAAVVLALVNGGASLAMRLVTVLTLLMVPLWFFWKGYRSRLQTPRDVLVYLAGMILLILAGIALSPAGNINLFALYWQVFMLLRLTPAIGVSLVISLLTQVAYQLDVLHTPFMIRLTTSDIILSVLGVTASGMFGWYIDAFAQEAARNARLLAELKVTQDELARREREAGVADERQRLAGEIHDTIAQQFTSIVTNLEAAESRLEANPTAALTHVRSAREAAREGIRDARAMVNALQPRVLEGRTLTEALQQITAREQAQPGPDVCFFSVGTAANVGRLQEAIMVRAVQEALTNVRKHAQASTVRVTLLWDDDDAILEITDNGQGFVPKALPPSQNGSHVGLRTMQQRVERAGGTWMIDSHPGDGTSLVVSFPIEKGARP